MGKYNEAMGKQGISSPMSGMHNMGSSPPRDKQLVPQLLGELGECINCTEKDLKGLSGILYPIMVQRVTSNGSDHDVVCKPASPECEIAGILRELISKVTDIHRTILRISDDVQV